MCHFDATNQYFPLFLSRSLPLSPYSLSPPWRSAHQHWFIIYSRAWETSSYWFNAYSNPALYPLLVRDAGASELGLAEVAREELGLMEETLLEQFLIWKAENFGTDPLNQTFYTAVSSLTQENHLWKYNNNDNDQMHSACKSRYEHQAATRYVVSTGQQEIKIFIFIVTREKRAWCSSLPSHNINAT